MKFIKKLTIIFSIIFSLWIVISIATKDFIFINDFHVSGQSMEPTFIDGDWVIYVSHKNPELGDIISFDCFHKCDLNGQTVHPVKRIIKIDDKGNYWLEGDNKENSYDSRYYGWLSPSDIRITGLISNFIIF